MVLNKKNSKQRLDGMLVTRGLALSRDEASRLILAGIVKVNGTRVDKRATLIDAGATIEVKGPSSPFVSRSGGKLAAALDAFSLSCEGLVAMDIGASTGGFTDCLLQRGVSRVYAVDVGYGQLDDKIRQDPRVVVLDRSNIRYLSREKVPDAIQCAVVDVSFISLTLVLPCMMPFLATEALVVALVKPQFEVGKGQVGSGGIVRNEAQRQSVTAHVLQCATRLGLQHIGVIDSPIIGRKGNREILIGLRRGGKQQHVERIV